MQPISLITSLLDSGLYAHPVARCVLIETHISWIILAGDYAYKIKKGIDLGFLDFSTLEKRRFFCEEELRLNRRLAPAIYLAVVPITGSPEHPQWDGEGAAIDYAVKMRAFPQPAQLDRLLAAGGLQAAQLDRLAGRIAEFHHRAEIAATGSKYGEPECILQPVEENFRQLRERVKEKEHLRRIGELADWSRTTWRHLSPLFKARKKGGYVRECHGDMHLANIAWVDEEPVVFDCIEFNANLRWIDVLSDLAFLVMDLEDRRQPELAWRFLNKYLEHTGDYRGMRVLRFYLVYRALVRGKIDAIRADQPGVDRKERLAAERDFVGYLRLALHYVAAGTPSLVLMYGLSGSGKTTVSGLLLERLGAVRLRSDVERKRMFGLKPLESGRAKLEEGIYGKEATEKTYRLLQELAEELLGAGFSVIVDAVCLDFTERAGFRRLAEALELPFLLIECRAAPEILQQRLVARQNDASDADLSVLAMQWERWQPLRPEEQAESLVVDTAGSLDALLLARRVEEALSWRRTLLSS